MSLRIRVGRTTLTLRRRLGREVAPATQQPQRLPRAHLGRTRRQLKLPKLRQASYSPEFLEPPRTVEIALSPVIQEAYVQGISTSSADDLVKALGMSDVSKSHGSQLAASRRRSARRVTRP